VARGMGKPCVVGCSDLRVIEARKRGELGGHTVREGDWVTIDGAAGEIMLGQAPLVEPEVGGEFATFMTWDTMGCNELEIRLHNAIWYTLY
jgi:pyruvate,orthophosphate dikinase